MKEFMVIADFNQKKIAIRPSNNFYEIGEFVSFSGKGKDRDGLVYALINLSDSGVEGMHYLFDRSKNNKNFLERLNGFVEDLILKAENIGKSIVERNYNLDCQYMDALINEMSYK